MKVDTGGKTTFSASLRVQETLSFAVGDRVVCTHQDSDHAGEEGVIETVEAHGWNVRYGDGAIRFHTHGLRLVTCQN